MRIALISSSTYPVPPPDYGGLELVVWNLAEALDDLGHDVTIIAPQGSRSTQHGNIIETIPPNTEVYHNWFQAELAAYNIYRPFLGYFDIIHDHTWFACVYLAKKDDPYLKICHTHHGMFNWQKKPDYVEHLNLIGCSEAQKWHISKSIRERCLYVNHGIDLNMYPFQAEKSDRYLSLNRITPFKGIDQFVNIVHHCNVHGDVCGEDSFVEDQNYVQQIKSLCAVSHTHYYGTVQHDHKVKLLQNAKALVALPMLDRGYLEIFGLNIAEAMACGTPVIGLKNGGLIDQIDDGVTGFLCNNIDEVEEIIKSNKVSEIDPADCRAHAEEMFSRDRMAENYLKLYRSILEKKEW